jgi:hypothetical protein
VCFYVQQFSKNNHKAASNSNFVRFMHVERSLEVRADFVEHRQHAGDMKYWNTGLAQRLRGMQRARILVRLNTDQTDKAEIIVRAHVTDDAIDTHAGIGFVDGYDFDIGVGAENMTPRTVVDEPINAGQRVCRYGRAVPANEMR